MEREVLAHGQVLTSRMVEFPDLLVVTRTHRGQMPEIRVMVGGVPIEDGDLDRAARLLNERLAA